MKAILTVALIVIAATARAEDLTAGKKIYTGKCARCHKFYDPARYDEKSWESWMGKMREKTRLNDDQYRQLTAYLDTVRARKP